MEMLLLASTALVAPFFEIGGAPAVLKISKTSLRFCYLSKVEKTINDRAVAVLPGEVSGRLNLTSRELSGQRKG